MVRGLGRHHNTGFRSSVRRALDRSTDDTVRSFYIYIGAVQEIGVDRATWSNDGAHNWRHELNIALGVSIKSDVVLFRPIFHHFFKHDYRAMRPIFFTLNLADNTEFPILNGRFRCAVVMASRFNIFVILKTLVTCTALIVIKRVAQRLQLGP